MEKRNDIERKYKRCSTRRLGRLYVKSFHTRSCESEDKSNGELENIVAVLKDRSFIDRMLIYELIRGRLEEYISEKKETKIRIFEEMLEYYDVNVLV